MKFLSATLILVSFGPFLVSSFVTGGSPLPRISPLLATPPQEAAPIPTAKVVSKVAVTGATGRTGSFVVQELLNRGVQVVGLVRDLKKASDIFASEDELLTITKCDLANPQAIEESVEGCDAVIWCATGFADGEPNAVDKIKQMLGLESATKKSIDAIGLPAIAKAMMASSTAGNNASYPKVVMLSSAGVTRPSWDAEKKKMFPGSADIPIVRLNPFGILDVKVDSENKLRETGIDYAIVRPAGLNDKWPAGSRPIFSQGDIAAGRINRKDVAMVLVDILSTSEACGKTFEIIGLANYPPARSIAPALAKLSPDADGLPSLEQLSATYTIMQQLLPGETQDAAALAMGQTYEQLDKKETGRLGKRGQENAEAVAPKPTSR